MRKLSFILAALFSASAFAGSGDTSGSYQPTQGSYGTVRGVVIQTSNDGYNSLPINTANPFPVTTVATATDITASGTITTQNLAGNSGACTAGSCVSLALNGTGTVTIQVTGTYTAAGGLTPQITTDGTNWITQAASTALLRMSNGLNSATIPSAAQDIFQIEINGHQSFRIVATGAVTGTATVTLRGAAGTSQVSANQGGAPWTQNITQVGSTAIVTGGVNGSLGVGGLAATGTALTGNPVLVGGSDGTNARAIATDTNGNLKTAPQPASPPTSNILVGRQSFTVTTGATTLVTVAAGKTFTGTLGASVSCQTVAGTATACNAVAAFTTTGAGVTPAAGAIFDCAATSGANAATGTVGSQAASYCSIPVNVNCASGTCTIAVASNNAGTASTVTATASGTQQ